MYLAAYAQRLGATGLTFFDDDVINFFSPHAKGKSAIFLLAIGKPLKRKPGRASTEVRNQRFALVGMVRGYPKSRGPSLNLKGPRKFLGA